MTKTRSAQKYFLQTALSYLGTPYIWGGDDPSGFDCSGFVLECLKTIGVVLEKEDFTADSLFNNLRQEKPIKFNPDKMKLVSIFS